MKQTYLLIAALPSTPLLLNVPEVTTDCTTSYVLCHKTESHQISTRCTEMTGDYSAEIKIVILQSIFKCQHDE